MLLQTLYSKTLDVLFKITDFKRLYLSNGEKYPTNA